MIENLKNSETETLHRLHSMVHYSSWIYSLVKPYVSGKILEIGCGIGSITRHLLDNNANIISIDINADHVKEMEKSFHNNPEVSVYQTDILKNNDEIFSTNTFSTIMLINVLEHIKEESETIKRIHELLVPGGNLVLLVPAFQWLYGTLDEIVGHLRRYDKHSITKLLEKHHLCPTYVRYINAFGLLGWWLNGSVLKKREFSYAQMTVYDRLIPLISKVEKHISLPFGQSILAVAKKK